MEFNTLLKLEDIIKYYKGELTIDGMCIVLDGKEYTKNEQK